MPRPTAAEPVSADRSGVFRRLPGQGRPGPGSAGALGAGVAGVVGIVAAAIGLAVFLAPNPFRPDAEAWNGGTVNPITGDRYTSAEEYRRVQDMTPEQIEAARRERSDNDRRRDRRQDLDREQDRRARDRQREEVPDDSGDTCARRYPGMDVREGRNVFRTRSGYVHRCYGSLQDVWQYIRSRPELDRAVAGNAREASGNDASHPLGHIGVYTNEGKTDYAGTIFEQQVCVDTEKGGPVLERVFTTNI
jgi:hypothetical protein